MTSETLANTFPEYVALRRYLIQNQDALVALLEKWDDDGDGRIDAKEFRQGCRVLQLDAGIKKKIPKEVFDELYDDIDIDGTGRIAFEDVATALKYMPLPEEEEEDQFMPMPDLAAEVEDRFMPRRTRRRSKSLPSSPIGSPGASPRSLSPIPSTSPASPTMRRPPPGKRPHLPQISSSLHASPAGHRSHASLSEEASHQPPRRTNLPRLGGGASDARSVSGASRASCSTSVQSWALSPQERAARRMQRERELEDASRRRLLPGFNVPGVGQYDPFEKSSGTIERRVARGKAMPSAWAVNSTPQHPLAMLRPVDMKKITSVGDPGCYVSQVHEMGRQAQRGGSTAISFYSAVPQRPIGSHF